MIAKILQDIKIKIVRLLIKDKDILVIKRSHIHQFEANMMVDEISLIQEMSGAFNHERRIRDIEKSILQRVLDEGLIDIDVRLCKITGNTIIRGVINVYKKPYDKNMGKNI